MLHYYSFSNFRSFRDRAEVSFSLTDQTAVNGWDRNSYYGSRVSTALAVMGPNGSGKTSLIQPIAFLAWFIPHSFSAKPEDLIPVSPHFGKKDSPTEFEVVADGNELETLWRYRLGIRQSHVVSESVEKKVRRGSWKRIFDRNWKGGKYEVNQSADFGLDATQAEAVRPNVSLISWALQFGVPLARELAAFTAVTNMDYLGRVAQRADAIETCARLFAQNPVLKDRMRAMLAQWDLGLTDVVIEERDMQDAEGKIKKRWITFGEHRESTSSKEHLLPFLEESSGTKQAFTLLALFLSILESGGIIAFDELESDLHPHMIEPILDLFSNPETNPNNAQIVFTCHSPEVLRILQKSQVILVEKDGLNSQAWRLDSMEGVRSDENRVAKYLAGAYGAIPRI